MWPGEVTTVLVRFAPTDLVVDTASPGTDYFAVDPTEGPGCVCHGHVTRTTR